MFFEVLRALACLLICCAYLAGQDSQPRPSCDFDKELAMAQGLLQAQELQGRSRGDRKAKPLQ
jgi:hypothetical protein